jgi:peptidyl-prolyl cis-trans isomerase A (cyclophilin A)
MQKGKSNGQNEGIFVEFETTKGKIVVQLEYVKTPVTVANFVSLVEGKNPFVKEDMKGKPFYDGLKFHRVIPEFMIQGGDPAGNGSGGTGYSFKDEFDPTLKHDKAGILSMANSGVATNSSQFFITHKDTPWLDGKHTVFGHVVVGQDIVNAIKQDDVMKKVTINRVGAAAKKFDAVAVFTNYYGSKGDDDKKQAAAQEEAKKKQMEEMVAAKKAYDEKYGPVLAKKVAYLATEKATVTKTESGLEYKFLAKGEGKKPAEGANVFVNYAGYFENGGLFDSSYPTVETEYGKYNPEKMKGGGYNPFPFQYGKKDGLIPGFLEGLNMMNFGDKMLLFIPAKLGYGERGAGGVIPPNANLIFELEMLETNPNAPPAPAEVKQ